MREIKQTKFGPNEGNCFDACLSSILEADINKFPNYKCSQWFAKYQEFLMTNMGIQIVTIRLNEDAPFPDVFCIITGDSPNYDCKHSVVGRGNKVIFDPSPSGKGLLGTWTEWEFEYLIPLAYNIK